MEEEEDPEEKEVEEDVDYVDDDEFPSDRNCKKKWCEVEYL